MDELDHIWGGITYAWCQWCGYYTGLSAQDDLAIAIIVFVYLHPQYNLPEDVAKYIRMNGGDCWIGRMFPHWYKDYDIPTICKRKDRNGLNIFNEIKREKLEKRNDED